MFPSSKFSAFLSHLLEECTNNNSKDPLGAIKSARKALRHLRACQAGIPDDGTEFPSQPCIAGVTSRAKTATTVARQRLVLVGKAKLVPLNSSCTHCVVNYLLFYSEDTDHSYAASTLSDEEYAALLDAAMRFPDKQV